MTRPKVKFVHRIEKQLAAAVALVFAGLSLATTASAVDLRDWGRKMPAKERFVVLAQFNNEAVLDKETQLVWERAPAQLLLSWPSARYVCLNSNTGGRRGWRLPSIHELSSLHDMSHGLPQGHPFKGLELVPGKSLFWSATQLTDHADKVWIATYAPSSGFYNASLNQSYRAWCVRGGGPISHY